MKFLILSGLMLGAIGCSSQRALNLTSTPLGAEIREITPSGEQKSLGQTPMKVSVSSMESLIVEKDSFYPQKIFVALNSGEQMDVNVILT